MAHRFIGIDPGLKGGIAILKDDGRIAAVHVMPVTDGEVDGRALVDLLREPCAFLAEAAVEAVHAMPGQGVSSMFTFGQGFGTILGVLAALGLAPVRVSPQRWKKDVLGARFDHADKQGAVDYCRDRWPDAALVPPRCRVAHSGIADALCLAAFAQRRGTLLD